MEQTFMIHSFKDIEKKKLIGDKKSDLPMIENQSPSQVKSKRSLNENRNV